MRIKNDKSGSKPDEGDTCSISKFSYEIRVSAQLALKRIGIVLESYLLHEWPSIGFHKRAIVSGQ